MLASNKRYDWQRDCVPFDQPKLHFDWHFQSDGLSVPPHAHLLVAVSGGSDSVALLHLLHEWKIRTGASTIIDVATVDHSLRAEAVEEARGVAETCERLGLNHSTLVWRRNADDKASASNARDARYQLLLEQAARSGATCLCLGHTMDDQAETILMRSFRGGGVRGLSGMTENSLVNGRERSLAIHRPLLSVRRQRLRNWLNERHISWVDDPSNADVNSERVRIRQFLNAQDPCRIGEIASLATHSARHRAWLANQAATFVKQHLMRNEDGTFTFKPCEEAVPVSVITEALAATLQHVTHAPYRVSVEKLVPMATSWNEGKPLRYAIGGILLANSRAGMVLKRENRNHNKPQSSQITDVQIIPSTDYPLHRALSAICI